jgi:hypothetical protein
MTPFPIPCNRRKGVSQSSKEDFCSYSCGTFTPAAKMMTSKLEGCHILGVELLNPTFCSLLSKCGVTTLGKILRMTQCITALAEEDDT